MVAMIKRPDGEQLPDEIPDEGALVPEWVERGAAGGYALGRDARRRVLAARAIE
jgi:hypothetical protein